MITRAHAVLDLPEPARAAGEAFWSAALGPLSVHRRVVGDGPPRVHLDLEVDDLDLETRRLRGLGAGVRQRVGDDGVTLTSPGGAVFCLVSGPASQDRPPPVTGADGVRRRLVQLCLDIPHGRGRAETTFWRAALPWRWVEIEEPEFLGRLVPPSGSPLQVLLQELGEDDPGADVRAHLDLGSDDVEASAAELVRLGAERVGTGDGWIALRDPVGMVCCVTRHDPDKP